MNNEDQRTDRYQQHGLMLVLTCVLSFAAFIFTIDISALGDEACNTIPRSMAAQQVEDAPAIPARQQSTPATQPMRAVLSEAIAAKLKANFPEGNNAGLSSFSNELAFSSSKPVEAANHARFLEISRSHSASARAPPRIV